MSQKLNADEVAVVIKAKKILKTRGLSLDTDVKTICQTAGTLEKDSNDNFILTLIDYNGNGLERRVSKMFAEWLK